MNRREQAYFRVLSHDRERRENYRECRAEVGAAGSLSGAASSIYLTVR